VKDKDDQYVNFALFVVILIETVMKKCYISQIAVSHFR